MTNRDKQDTQAQQVQNLNDESKASLCDEELKKASGGLNAGIGPYVKGNSEDSFHFKLRKRVRVKSSGKVGMVVDHFAASDGNPSHNEYIVRLDSGSAGKYLENELEHYI